MTTDALSKIAQQWARGDQAGALAASAALLARHSDDEQIVLTHSGLQLHRQDFDGAAATIHTFMAAHTASPTLLANLSIALRGKGHLEQAAAMATEVTEQAPHLVSGWNALALAQSELKDYAAAEVTLRAALEQHPDHPALKHHLNQTLEALGKSQRGQRISPTGDLLNFANTFSKESNPIAIEALLRKAIHFNPEFWGGYLSLGLFLLRFDRDDEARVALEQSLERNPDCASTQFFLQLLKGEQPARPDSKYVTALFDGYAERFDEHLVEELAYRAPQLLTEKLLSIGGDAQLGNTLDLGCGTGLMGPLLAAHTSALDGIDLSENMLQKARLKSSYRDLHHGEIVEFLKDADTRWDTMVAADVFCYLGDLAPVLSAMADKLSKDGRAAFTVERHDDDGYWADPKTGRYKHARQYLSDLVPTYFLEQEISPVILRMNGGQPVNGWLVLAQNPH